MSQKKVVRTTEKRLSNKELNKILSNVKFSNTKHQSIFNKIKDQLWLRQYARQSRSAANNIIKKVKKGIRQGKYGSTDLGERTDETRFEKPTPKRKSSNKKREKVVKQEIQKNKPVKRKIREQIRQTEKTAPSGRKYSKTEIHEGIKSKRAVEWRKKNNISEKDV